MLASKLVSCELVLAFLFCAVSGSIIVRIHRLPLLWLLPVSLVDTNTHNMIDEFGRVRIFHGVNAVFKIHPYIPDPVNWSPQNSLTPQDAANLHEWGFNFVRLGMMWPGAEPVRGQYNQSYFDTAKQVVQNLAKYDIQVLLDMHQDLLSEKFCGEGVPPWAAIPDPLAVAFPFPVWGFNQIPLDNVTGYPLLSECLKTPFFEFYFAEATASAFQSLYNNQNGIQDSLAAFWKQVAINFGKIPNVVGYEIINEPWCGDIYKDINLLVEAGRAEKVNLAPMYEKVAAQIRTVDQEKLIFFEPAVSDGVVTFQTGFETVPGGYDYRNRSIFSYHVYCGLTNPEGDPTWRPLCEVIDEMHFRFFLSEANRIGGGSFMTEWGASGVDGPAIQELNDMAGYADDVLGSWSWWQFKSYEDITTASVGPVESFYDASGNLQLAKVKALSRTYAYAIAGQPLAMKFDPNTAAFKFVYSLNPSISKPTMIFANQKWYYPNGYNVQIFPATNQLWWNTTAEINRIAISHSPSLPMDTQVQILITPK